MDQKFVIGGTTAPAVATQLYSECLMKPGRELDALVAEKVMGWKRCLHEVWVDHGHNNFGQTITSRHQEPALVNGEYVHVFKERLQPYNSKPLPNYSTDMTAAWEVFDKLKLVTLMSECCGEDRDYSFKVYFDSCWKKWVAEFEWSYYDIMYSCEAKTAPLAICLAALKAKGVEV